MFSLLKKTFTKWDQDNAMRLGAALSYYAVFSLSPLLIIVISIAGIVFGQEAVRGEFNHQFESFMGKEAADALQSILASSYAHSSAASVIGIIILIIGASGAFVELRSALNKIWGVAPKKLAGIKGFIRTRLLSFAMVLSLGFLMLVALVVNTALAAMGKYMGGVLPAPEAVLQLATAVVSFGLITLLFALIFKVLPDTKIEWKDVWVGAVLTSFLFTVGKFAIGLYIGKSSPASVFGAAGSVVLILVWAYYSSLILFFGAEFTYVFSQRHGSNKRHAKGLILEPAA